MLLNDHCFSFSHGFSGGSSNANANDIPVDLRSKKLYRGQRVSRNHSIVVLKFDVRSMRGFIFREECANVQRNGMKFDEIC